MFAQEIGDRRLYLSLRQTRHRALAGLAAGAAALLLIGTFPLSARAVPGPLSLNLVRLSPQGATPLAQGQVVERELRGGETDRYQVALSAGQFAGLDIQQHGIAVVEELFAPDGRSVVEFAADVRPEAQVRLAFVAEAAGVYRLTLKPLTKVAAGRYEISLTEVRAATDHDRLLHEARKLDTQARSLETQRKYDDALPLVERALEIAEKEFGPDHPYVGHLLNALGYVHLNKGTYTKALQLYQRALAVNQKALGPEHPETVASVRGLGTTYGALNEFQKGEALLQQALQVTEKMLGADDINFAESLLALGYFHMRRSDLARAEQELQRGIMMAEKFLGADSLSLATPLNNLGMLYNSRKEYDRAEPLLKRALEIAEKKLGADSPELAMPLQNLGLIAQEKRKDYPQALGYYWHAVHALEKGVGPDSPNVARILNNIANIYKSQGDYARSLELHQRVYEIFEKSLGPFHGVTLVSLGNIARTYAAMGDVPNAIKFQARTDEVIERNLALNLATGSERQKLAYFDSLAERTERTISLHVNLAPGEPAARDLAALVILQRKGRVLDALSGSLSALRQRLSGEDQKLLDELNAVAAQLARLELNGPGQTPPEEFHKQVATLEEQKERLESEISRRSAEFRAQAQPVTLAAVRAAVPRDTALIEFAIYRPFNPRLDNAEAYGEPRYIAYVVRQQNEVEWRELGPAREIDAAVSTLRAALADPQRKDVRELARAVDERVMQPLRALFSETHLLISPDGELNLIPFEALVDEQGHYLLERYAITYLTSGRDLLRMQVARESKSPALVVANPLFGEPASEPIARANGPAKSAASTGRRRSTTTARDLAEVYFAPLSGTAQEARAIKALFPEATVLTEQQADEATLKRATAPRILHIATHGFFLQEAAPAAADDLLSARRGISASAKVDNPLLRSGLALAGANLRAGGGDDGILTALEASGLNLWGTKLVTLSACDTGLGEVKNGEGVYGLRRALVLAGAETQVMSLWAVSDYVTREMMTEYYKGLKQGAGRGEALRQVKLTLLRRKDRQHPFYWASFIQSGDWASLDDKR